MRIDKKDITPPARERIFEYTIVLTADEARRLTDDLGSRASRGDSVQILYRQLLGQLQ